jgi:hypothetical protein
MLLTIDMAAIAVFGPIQPSLLALGDVTVVFRFINGLALGNVRVMSLVPSRLLSGHRAFRKTLVNPRLLIIQSLIHLILAGMVRHRRGLRHRLHRDQRGTHKPGSIPTDIRGLHDHSQNGYTTGDLREGLLTSSLKKRQMFHKTFADPSR